jgi:2-polyprenyl-3-methyl-5-hydroxy-6-metoxy-1,4-benzoquinol methylase
VSAVVELRDRLRRYYTAYYRDTLGIPGWPTLVDLRQEEEVQERGHFERLRAVLPPDALSGRILNVGCGTGGFNAVAAAAGSRIVGMDADAEAIAICGAKRRTGGGVYVRAEAERLPFRGGTFDVVYCFSVIEHVASVEATVAEMVRVTRSGGAIYVHTPNAWSWWEGHYKVFWAPFLPAPLGRAYLRLRGRPTAYLATLRRLTVARLRRAFARAGAPAATLHDATPARESVGPLRSLASVYYLVTGTSPFIELVVRKP